MSMLSWVFVNPRWPRGSPEPDFGFLQGLLGSLVCVSRKAQTSEDNVKTGLVLSRNWHSHGHFEVLNASAKGNGQKGSFAVLVLLLFEGGQMPQAPLLPCSFEGSTATSAAIALSSGKLELWGKHGLKVLQCFHSKAELCLSKTMFQKVGERQPRGRQSEVLDLGSYRTRNTTAL